MKQKRGGNGSLCRSGRTTRSLSGKGARSDLTRSCRPKILATRSRLLCWRSGSVYRAVCAQPNVLAAGPAPCAQRRCLLVESGEARGLLRCQSAGDRWNKLRLQSKQILNKQILTGWHSCQVERVLGVLLQRDNTRLQNSYSE